MGAVTLVPRFRRRAVDKLKPQVDAARTNLHQLAGQPSKLVRLFGGAVVSQVLFALVLGASLHAYGASASLGELLVVNTIASLLGGAHRPGARRRMGVIEGGLIAGFTALGIPNTIAVAATLTARLMTAYLPPIWGYPDSGLDAPPAVPLGPTSGPGVEPLPSSAVRDQGRGGCGTCNGYCPPGSPSVPGAAGRRRVKRAVLSGCGSGQVLGPGLASGARRPPPRRPRPMAPGLRPRRGRARTSTPPPAVVTLDSIPAPRPGPPPTIFHAPGITNQIALTIDDGTCEECVAAYVAFAQQSGHPHHLLAQRRRARRSGTHCTRRCSAPASIESGQVQIANHTFSHHDLRRMSGRPDRGRARAQRRVDPAGVRRHDPTVVPAALRLPLRPRRRHRRERGLHERAHVERDLRRLEPLLVHRRVPGTRPSGTSRPAPSCWVTPTTPTATRAVRRGAGPDQGAQPRPGHPGRDVRHVEGRRLIRTGSRPGSVRRRSVGEVGRPGSGAGADWHAPERSPPDRHDRRHDRHPHQRHNGSRGIRRRAGPSIRVAGRRRRRPGRLRGVRAAEADRRPQHLAGRDPLARRGLVQRGSRRPPSRTGTDPRLRRPRRGEAKPPVAVHSELWSYEVVLGSSGYSG